MNLGAPSMRAADTQARLGPWPPGDGARAHHECQAQETEARAWAPGSRRCLGAGIQPPPVGSAYGSVDVGVGVGASLGGGIQTGPGGGVAEGGVPVPLDVPSGVPASEPGVRELIPAPTGARDGKAGEAGDATRGCPGVARSGEPPCSGVAEGIASPDPSLACALAVGEPAGGSAPGAPSRPGKAPNAATAIAATITHAPAAAIPIRPARRPGRARLLTVPRSFAGDDAATREARMTGTGSSAWRCSGARRAVGGEGRVVIRAVSSAGLSVIFTTPGVGRAANVVPARRGVSASRNGAHLRQAASTRFQQSEQHVTPQPGHAWSEMWADANESLSRPQRSQNWAPRSTSHSRLARPLRTYPHITVAGARSRGACRWYRARRAFVPFGAGRHHGAWHAPTEAD